MIGIDERWCEVNHPPRLTHPFPFWLYGESTFDYVSNMMQYKSLEAASRKIKLILGKTEAAPAKKAPAKKAAPKAAEA